VAAAKLGMANSHFATDGLPIQTIIQRPHDLATLAIAYTHEFSEVAHG